MNKNKIRLIKIGINFNKEAQKEFNKCNYKEAQKLKKEAIFILQGFKEQDINNINEVL